MNITWNIFRAFRLDSLVDICFFNFFFQYIFRSASPSFLVAAQKASIIGRLPKASLSDRKRISAAQLSSSRHNIRLLRSVWLADLSDWLTEGHSDSIGVQGFFSTRRALEALKAHTSPFINTPYGDLPSGYSSVCFQCRADLVNNMYCSLQLTGVWTHLTGDVSIICKQFSDFKLFLIELQRLLWYICESRI